MDLREVLKKTLGGVLVRVDWVVRIRILLSHMNYLMHKQNQATNTKKSLWERNKGTCVLDLGRN